MPGGRPCAVAVGTAAARPQSYSPNVSTLGVRRAIARMTSRTTTPASAMMGMIGTMS